MLGLTVTVAVVGDSLGFSLVVCDWGNTPTSYSYQIYFKHIQCFLAPSTVTNSDKYATLPLISSALRVRVVVVISISQFTVAHHAI